jgi:hypothetical protein
MPIHSMTNHTAITLRAAPVTRRISRRRESHPLFPGNLHGRRLGRLFSLLGLLAVTLATLAPAAGAKTIALNASANLRITTSHGNNIQAQGPISGTFAGTLRVHVSLNSGSRMTATFTGSSRSGSLAGSVSAEYYPSGRVTIYSGSARIASGTGIYAHARGVGIKVEGTLNRSRHLITMRISGHLSV